MEKNMSALLIKLRVRVRVSSRRGALEKNMSA